MNPNRVRLVPALAMALGLVAACDVTASPDAATGDVTIQPGADSGPTSDVATLIDASPPSDVTSDDVTTSDTPVPDGGMPDLHGWFAETYPLGRVLGGAVPTAIVADPRAPRHLVIVLRAADPSDPAATPVAVEWRDAHFGPILTHSPSLGEPRGVGVVGFDETSTPWVLRGAPGSSGALTLLLASSQHMSAWSDLTLTWQMRDSWPADIVVPAVAPHHVLEVAHRTVFDVATRSSMVDPGTQYFGTTLMNSGAYAVLPAPDDGDTFHVLSASQVQRCHLAGTQFDCANQAVTGLVNIESVRGVAIAPHDAQRWFVLADLLTAGRAIFVSTDGAATFTSIPLGSVGPYAIDIDAWTFSPVAPDTIVVHSPGGTFPDGTVVAASLRVTVDRGAHWTEVPAPDFVGYGGIAFDGDGTLFALALDRIYSKRL